MYFVGVTRSFTILHEGRIDRRVKLAPGYVPWNAVPDTLD